MTEGKQWNASVPPEVSAGLSCISSHDCCEKCRLSGGNGCTRGSGCCRRWSVWLAGKGMSIEDNWLNSAENLKNNWSGGERKLLYLSFEWERERREFSCMEIVFSRSCCLSWVAVMITTLYWTLKPGTAPPNSHSPTHSHNRLIFPNADRRRQRLQKSEACAVIEWPTECRDVFSLWFVSVFLLRSQKQKPPIYTRKIISKPNWKADNWSESYFGGHCQHDLHLKIECTCLFREVCVF